MKPWVCFYLNNRNVTTKLIIALEGKFFIVSWLEYTVVFPWTMCKSKKSVSFLYKIWYAMIIPLQCCFNKFALFVMNMCLFVADHDVEWQSSKPGFSPACFKKSRRVSNFQLLLKHPTQNSKTNSRRLVWRGGVLGAIES